MASFFVFFYDNSSTLMASDIDIKLKDNSVQWKSKDGEKMDLTEKMVLMENL